MYCAVLQEMRELAVRGVDGPGLHILDVLPDAYADAINGKAAAAERKKVVDRMLTHSPVMFKSRPKGDTNGVVDGTAFALNRAANALVGWEIDGTATSSAAFGWFNYTDAPGLQEMSRGLSRTKSLPDVEMGITEDAPLNVQEKNMTLTRSWSISY